MLHHHYIHSEHWVGVLSLYLGLVENLQFFVPSVFVYSTSTQQVLRYCIYDTNNVSEERSKNQVTISTETMIYIQALSCFIDS
jgi:hypothetical protein